jgi:RHS repeat-associated protein
MGTQGWLRVGLGLCSGSRQGLRLLLLRRLALLNTVAFCLSFALITPIQALAQGVGKSLSQSSAPKLKLPVTHLPVKLYPPANSHCLQPLPDGAATASVRKPSTPALSLLDEVGRLGQYVSASQVAAWQRQLHQPHLSRQQAARLLVWRGEVRLAHDQQPQQAVALFQKAQQKVERSDPWYGLAAYDRVIADYYQGAYRQAAGEFHHLLVCKPGLTGFDHRTCALWSRHANACAGYHAERAALGIPEPLRLDPQCGAAALAAYLRANGLPFDKKHVLSVCRVTGVGSTLGDVLTAAKKLGLFARAVTADDAGLMALPKPCLSYIEHDHFVSVVASDKQGVSYLCSDCGAWPGGRINLTWKQWHALEPGLYAVFSKPGSALAGALAQLPLPSSTPNAQAREEGKGKREKTSFRTPNAQRLTPRVQLASLHAQGLGAQMQWLSRLASHVLLATVPLQGRGCGGPPIAQHCPCPVCQPKDSGGGGGSAGTMSGGSSASPVMQLCAASSGDPVNLATLEEEYTPPTDLTVYNPIGPSVVWGRLYNSLRGLQGTYEYDDFGSGWSHPYNVGVYDPGVITGDPQLRQGGSGKVNESGSDKPATGLTWDILNSSGTTVATSSVPNSFTVSLASGQFTITVPSSATVANHYEVRYNTGHPTFSGFFDIIPSSATNPQIQPGGSASFPSTGTQAPATGLTWDILNNGSATVATSSTPNGFTVSFASNTFTVGVPLLTPCTSNYTVRYTYSGSSHASAAFDVSAYGVDVQPGTKYVLFPDSSRVAFTAPAVPTASQPAVTCTVQSGVPLLVEWDYDPSDPSGHYKITFADRSQWITTNYAKILNTNSLVYLLQQQKDSNGNAIYFYYSTTAGGVSGFPLLSSITDSNNSALLTITRSSGNITQVADRYGRSIYYHVGTYATSNVPAGFPQSLPEVDHVSQIVATGTGSPPDRYAYGYQNVLNGEPGTGSPGEAIPMLHTLTVPSPTGTGNSTATINYTSDGMALVSSLVDANGNTHSYTDGGLNKITATLTDVHSNTLYSYTVSFDSNMSETSRTDGAGNIISAKTFADPNDPYRPSQVEDGNGYAVGGAGGQGTWTFTWDSVGNLETIKTPRQKITTYSRSYTNFGLGELSSVQTQGKQATSFTYYEPSGLVHTVTAPLPGTVDGTQNVTTSYTYDGLGNVLTVTGPGNNAATSITTTFNYTTDGTYNQADAIGQPITVTDNLGKVTHVRYDSRANTLSAVDALGNEVDATYNLADQTVQTTFPATGQTGTGHSYALNSYLYTGGPTTSAAAYTESGTQVRQVTPTYGLEGELLGKSGSTEAVTFTYDGAYRLKTMADGNGHTTSYYFNTTGYLAGITYPGYTGPAWPNLSGSDSVQFTSFDADGNLLTRIDGRGITTNYVYNDVISRLTAIQYPATPGINVSLTYDGYGRLLTQSDGAGSYSYNYDDWDVLTSVQTTYSGLPAQTISYGFYPNGSRSSMSTPAGTFSYSYDADGRPSSLTNPYSETSSWTYLDNGWLWKQIVNNSSSAQVVDTIFTYNALGEVTDRTNQNDTSHTVYSDFGSQVHDGVGNLTSVTANLPATSTYGGLTTYQYDSKDQLTQEQSARNSGYTNGFGFDAAGNPTSYLGVVQNFNSDNQNTASGYVYDGNGNPSTYKGTLLTFNAADRLTSIGSLLTCGYKSGGMRAWKQNSSATTYFLYDGDTPVCELSSTGTVTAANTFGPFGLLSRHTAGSSNFYAFDPQGNVSQGLNSNGTIAYSSFFNAQGIRVSTGSNGDPYSGFGGQWGYYTDGETGLQLLGHRYYDANTGRFLHRDPIGYNGGINLYNYTGNNRINSIDPLGFCTPDEAEIDPEKCLQEEEGSQTSEVHTGPVPGSISGGGFAGGGEGSDIGEGIGEVCDAIEDIFTPDPPRSENPLNGLDIGDTGLIDPWAVNYTQDSASWYFGDKDPITGEPLYNIGDTQFKLREDVNFELPPVDLYTEFGEFWSMDNRRLVTYRSAGTLMPFTIVPKSNMRHRFSTLDNGESLVLRNCPDSE